MPCKCLDPIGVQYMFYMYMALLIFCFCRLFSIRTSSLMLLYTPCIQTLVYNPTILDACKIPQKFVACKRLYGQGYHLFLYYIRM